MQSGRRRFIAALELLMRICPLALVAALGLWIGKYARTLTVEDILSYTPENLLLAALVILGLYAVKSLSIFFPLLLLYFSVGSVFPPLWAVGVNLCGLFISVSIPYGLGRLAGREWMERLIRRYKKAAQLERLRSNNEWFLSYILRVINLLPGDVVSLFLGSMNTNYLKYVTGSLAGLAPTMLAATFMGVHITDPSSWEFLLSAGLTVSVSIVSFVLYRRVLLKKR
ncbi:MAG: TVP38/TMEM64 family protein [Provencibacterium sp.]|nr:TVP38/TMEM64 family protein [Provencibacterium sp.]